MTRSTGEQLYRDALASNLVFRIREIRGKMEYRFASIARFVGDGKFGEALLALSDCEEEIGRQFDDLLKEVTTP